MEWMILPLRRYFEFSGRSRRKEYWMFVLFTIIVGVVLGVIDEVLGLKTGSGDSATDSGILGSAFSLATFIPSLAVAVRRLHDTDRSGLWLLLPVAATVAAVVVAVGMFTTGSGGFAALTAIGFGAVSFIVLLVFLCLDGTAGPNRFGDDPKNPMSSYDGVFD